MDEYDKYFEDDKIPSDGAEDADCCKLFSCCWVRQYVEMWMMGITNNCP